MVSTPTRKSPSVETQDASRADGSSDDSGKTKSGSESGSKM